MPYFTITAPVGTMTGPGTVRYSVAGHGSTSPRSGTIMVAGRTFTVLQGAMFLDVPLDHPFYEVIGKISARGVTVGCGGGNYCPNDPATREQMAAFIIRALGEFNPPSPPMASFADVPMSNQFFPFIEQLFDRGITTGCGSGAIRIYCPSDPATREQAAAFIIRALHPPGYMPPAPGAQRFADVLPSNFFYAYIEELALRGITVGCGSNPLVYCPALFVTRGEMAAFLVRAFEL